MKLFSQYGYRRTSIDDIAREAEIAKGTVYLSFKSKEEIFRALCESLIERTEAAVKVARETSGPIDERLVAMLEAKFGFLFETVYRSAHAAELMDSKNRLSADLFAQSGRRYMKILREMLGEAIRAGELEPSRMQLDATTWPRCWWRRRMESSATRRVPRGTIGGSGRSCGLLWRGCLRRGSKSAQA